MKKGKNPEKGKLESPKQGTAIIPLIIVAKKKEPRTSVKLTSQWENKSSADSLTKTNGDVDQHDTDQEGGGGGSLRLQVGWESQWEFYELPSSQSLRNVLMTASRPGGRKETQFSP